VQTTITTGGAVLTGNVMTGKSCAVSIVGHQLDDKWTSTDDFVLSDDERAYVRV